MFKWDFNSRSEGWNQSESSNINAIEDIAFELFGHGRFDLVPNIQIIKNTTETFTKEYKGDNPISMSELKARYDGLVELLKSDSKYDRVLNALERIIREIELFYDDNPRQLNADDVRKLVGGIQNLPDRNRFPEIADALDEFVDNVGEVPFTSVILGETYKDEKIIIYLQAIEDNSNGVDKHALVEQVLVHELYHAMHYHHSTPYVKGAWLSTSIKSEAVKESLADYFAYLYILREFYRSFDLTYRILSEELENKWNRHKYPNYPYSGAKVFDFGKDESFYEARYIEEDCLFRLVQNKALTQWETPYRVITETLKGGEKAGKEEYYRRHPEEYIANGTPLSDKYEREEYTWLLKSIEKNFRIKLYIDRFPNYTIDDLRRIDSSNAFRSPEYSKTEFESRFYSGSVREIYDYVERLPW